MPTFDAPPLTDHATRPLGQPEPLGSPNEPCVSRAPLAGSVLIIGRGRLGMSLHAALQATGQAVHLLSARDCGMGGLSEGEVSGSQGPRLANQTWAQARWVFLTVPDDAIARTAERLPWQAGQSAVHCSAATPLSALAAAAEAGAAIGGFHPLQIFSNPLGSPELLAGSTVAIEAEGELFSALHALATSLAMRPLNLSGAARTLYHLAANFSASFLLATLGEGVRLWERAGLPVEQALPALLPLARGSLQGAEQRGLGGALSGPVARGDVKVVETHLRALEKQGPQQPPNDSLHEPTTASSSLGLYRLLALRQLEWLADTDRLTSEQRGALGQILSASGCSEPT